MDMNYIGISVFSNFVISNPNKPTVKVDLGEGKKIVLIIFSITLKSLYKNFF